MLFALCSLVAVAAEWAVGRLAPLAVWGLARVHLGLPWRWAIATTALAALMARATDAVPVGWVVAGAAVVGLAGGALEGLAQVVEHLRKSPVLSRGLPLGGVAVPREPRALLRHRAGLLWPAVLVLLAVPPLAVGTGVPDGLAVGRRGGRRAGRGGRGGLGRRLGAPDPPGQPALARAACRAAGGDRARSRPGALLRRQR